MLFLKSLVHRSFLNSKENIVNRDEDYWGIIQTAMFVYAYYEIEDKNLERKNLLWKKLNRPSFKSKKKWMQELRELGHKDAEVILKFLYDVKDIEVIDTTKVDMWNTRGIIGILADEFDSEY